MAVTVLSQPSASLTTWTTQLSTLESRAAEHDRYSSELILQIADPLKNIAARYEELRKSHAEYAIKLEKERDMSYGDLKKTKGRYDGSCQEVENRRKKTESSFDHGKSKAQSAYQQQVMEMHNVKVSEVSRDILLTRMAWLISSYFQNTYLISINITNKQKQKYYHEYVPDLLDVRGPMLPSVSSEPRSKFYSEPTGPLGDSRNASKLAMVACRPVGNICPFPMYRALTSPLW